MRSSIGLLLGVMLLGLGILIRKFDVVPHSNIAVLAQLTEASLGKNIVFYAIQLITMVLLALAANTSFGSLPVLAHDSFADQWEDWQPNIPLITLRTTHRSLSRPIVKYLCQIEADDIYHRLVVLIPEVQPPKLWEYLLFNQRGAILDRAIRRGTVNVVLCRLRYRLGQFEPRPAAPSAAASAATAHASPEAPPPP